MLVAIFTVSCAKPSTDHLPLNDVVRDFVGAQPTNAIVFLFDQPLDVVYDKTDEFQSTGGSSLVGILFNAMIIEVNKEIIAARRRTAVEETLPFIALASKIDIPTDVTVAIHETFSKRNNSLWLKKITAEPLSNFPTESGGREAFSDFVQHDGKENEGLLILSWTQALKNNYAVIMKAFFFLPKISRPVFRNSYLFICRGSKDSDWTEWWSQEKFRTAYVTSIKALPAMLSRDFSQSPIGYQDLDISRNDLGYIVASCKADWWGAK